MSISVIISGISHVTGIDDNYHFNDTGNTISTIYRALEYRALESNHSPQFKFSYHDNLEAIEVLIGTYVPQKMDLLRAIVIDKYDFRIILHIENIADDLWHINSNKNLEYLLLNIHECSPIGLENLDLPKLKLLFVVYDESQKEEVGIKSTLSQLKKKYPTTEIIFELTKNINYDYSAKSVRSFFNAQSEFAYSNIEKIRINLFPELHPCVYDLFHYDSTDESQLTSNEKWYKSLSFLEKFAVKKAIKKNIVSSNMTIQIMTKNFRFLEDSYFIIRRILIFNYWLKDPA